MTGRAARANAASIRTEQADRPVYWYPCVVCHLAFPSQARPDPSIERLDVCQRCCVADIATLMRGNPDTVLMLPVVRALLGKAQVIDVHPEVA